MSSLNDLKPGDLAFVKEDFHRSTQYYKVRVTKRSKTRVVIKRPEHPEQIFTLEGDIYPRQRGYYSRSYKLLPITPETAAMYDKSFQGRRVTDKLHNLSKQTESIWNIFTAIELKLLADILDKYLEKTSSECMGEVET